MDGFRTIDLEESPMQSASAEQTVFLRRRLTQSLVFAMTLVLIFVSGFFYIFTISEIEEKFTYRMDHLFEILSISLARALYPLDRDVVSNLGNATLSNDFISGVAIRDRHGNDVFSGTSTLTDFKRVEIRSIFYHGTPVGELEVHFCPIDLVQNLKRDMWYLLLSWLLSVFTIILLTKLLVRRYLRMPLASFTNLARSYLQYPGIHPARTTPYFEFQPIEAVLKNQADDMFKQLQALAKSEKRFARVMKCVDEGFFDLTLETKEVYFSPSWKKMLGYEDHEIKNDFSEWERLAVPQFATSASKILNEFQEGKRKRFSTELKMKHKEGHWIYVLSRGKAICDENGNALRIVGTHLDITERKQYEIRLRTALNEREMLLQELYHRTKNNMLVIISMLSLQSAYTEDENLLKIFREIENRIQTMALVHKTLYRSKNLSEISLKEYVSDLSQLLLDRYHAKSDKSISVINDIDDVSMVIDNAIPCGMVLNELISNSLQYAFPDKQKGEIQIQIRKTDQGEMIIRFFDNGVGLPEGFNFRNTSTLGMRLIFTVVEHQLKGDVEFVNDNGLNCRIRYKDTMYGTRV